MNKFKVIYLFIFLPFILFASKKPDNAKDTLLTNYFTKLHWRSIGPALVSGRISDIAVDPENISHYYVAAASGHLWETYDNGITFKPIFDKHGVYAMSCVAIAPSNHNIIWLGTGENNHQRVIGYGNGVYKSIDGGKTWKNMGLPKSYQIGKILIHPTNPNIVYVAAEGSIWGPNKERGVYKTTDGGKTWEKVLFISENTGVADICFSPDNPDILYAGAEQRRRKQYTKIGGGPESAFYKSTDAGKTWNKITNGIPNVDKSGMSICVSLANPDYVYVMFEASNGKGGFYRSTNAGGSFEKMSDYFSSGQYFSEIYPDPINPDKVTSVDTYSRYTLDGGKTWKTISTAKRHVDDHAYWVQKDNTNHFMIAGDGGLYETWNNGKTFTHKKTLPVTQFYRVSTDNSLPFYWVYGGTQDNNSIGGPSRNLKRSGVSSYEWIKTLGGDGFWQANDPNDPNIIYSAYQYGNIYRFNKLTGEHVKIKPQPNENELSFRWNWDTPFILSNHNPDRLYIAANYLFVSNDKGNSWTKISPDLTRNEDRNQFKVMGKYWPSDAVAKDVSTSLWGTIVSLNESPVKEGLIYVGTDDGLIQITEDNGKTWRKANINGIPKYIAVSDIYASPVDENVVFATFNNIKDNDFKPYIYKSTDKGKTWQSIKSNLPDTEAVYCVYQDDINPNMLLTGTELGIYLSLDGGKYWKKFNNGIPDIPVRDIAIQKRDRDIVIATFGRGMYILDDYTALQNAKTSDLKEKAKIYKPQTGLLYIQNGDRYGVGNDFYLAPNPPYGITFTYLFNDSVSTLKAERLKKEKELFKKSEKIPQPDKETLKKEKYEIPPHLEFVIKDNAGDIIKKLFAKPNTGINRITWNFRLDSHYPANLTKGKVDYFNNKNNGLLCSPGKYSIELNLITNDSLVKLTDPVYFNVKPLKYKNLNIASTDEQLAFYKDLNTTAKNVINTEKFTYDLIQKSKYIEQTIHQYSKSDYTLLKNIHSINEQLDSLDFIMHGTKPKASQEEVPPAPTPLKVRFNEITEISWASMTAPTTTQAKGLNILKHQINKYINSLNSIDLKLNNIEKTLNKIKAPYTPGRKPVLYE